MRVDLDADSTGLQALPRFQRALWQARRLHGLVLLVGTSSALLGLVANFVGLFAADSIWLPLLCNVLAALLLLVAVALGARHVAEWRVRTLGHMEAEVGAVTEVDAEAPSGLLAPLRLGWERLLGSHLLWLGGLALLALLVVKGGWRLDLPAAPLGQAAGLFGGLALLLAFALLVMERYLTACSAAEWPEAMSLALQARVVIATLLLAALCLFFAGQDRLWPVRLAVLGGLLPALVALELLLRALLGVFSPPRDTLEPRLIGHSLLAGLLRWPPRPLQVLQDELQQRFGIDLRQIWAFSFMRRASLPVLALMALVGWLLSGVSEIPLDGRGVYERLGKPVAVLAPGLHAGLPWPFGRVRAVENGVIHELATSTDATLETASADGPAPASANRLWDGSHTSENSQVIASASDGKQSFQVVNMDVRFIYRIGLDEPAALAAIYHSANLEALIRSTASRVLVHAFAARTLDGLLGEERLGLAADIGKAVQADLDRLDSGVEILATLVEAIHPPAGAANAYHGVQAAQIGAQALIASERGSAAQTRNQAQLVAQTRDDQAQAFARETRTAAQVAERRFDAERQAWHSAGQAFLDEEYFSQLSQGLDQAKSLVIDHRIPATKSPTLDLRSFTAPVDPGTPRQ